MDYVTSLLNRYYEIFQFIINSDQYKEFIYLKKQLRLPYSYTFEQDSEIVRELESTVEVKTITEQTQYGSVSKQVNNLDRMLELYDLIISRVWDKFQHKLIDIDDWDPTLDKVDVFHLLGGSDPVTVIPSTSADLLGKNSPLEKLGLDRHQFFIVAIDPQVTRKEAWKQLNESLAALLGDKPTPRNRKKQAIPKYEAFRLAREGKTFSKIGIKYGVDRTTAHKAFIRDYYDINGIQAPSKRNRKSVQKHQLSKDCPTCSIFKTCNKLCPEMESLGDLDDVKQQEKLMDDPDTITKLSNMNIWR